VLHCAHDTTRPATIAARRSRGSRLVRTVSAPMLAFLRRVAKVVSPEVVDDIFAFLEAFAGMEEGFRQRAAAVDAVLAGSTSSFVIVTAPTSDAVDESRYLIDRLTASKLGVDAVVVNRCLPRLVGASAATLAAEAPKRGALRGWYNAALDLATAVEAEEAVLAPLRVGLAGTDWRQLQLLDHDIHDLDGIAEIEAMLWA
jgi:anion-transporting  ArsA/GET3 family ATPase